MDIVHWVQQQVQTNAVFNGVLGASIIGGLTMWARSSWSRGQRLFTRYFTTSFSVTNEDPILYTYVNQWLKTEKIHKSPRRVVLQKDAAPSNESLFARSDVPTDVSEISDQDSYFGWYKFLPVQISFSSKEREQGPILRVMSLKFYFRGPGWLSKFSEKFKVDAKGHFNKSKSLSVWSCNRYGHWRMRSIPFRDISSVYMAPDDKKNLLADLTKFQGSEDVYNRIGKPYRRNYLFHGSPGTGKTSLIWALATILDREVFVFTDLSGMDSFEDAYGGIKPGSIVVFEDIDCIGTETTRDIVDDDQQTGMVRQKKGGVTLSSLLNVLDGVHSLHNSLVFVTTNHIERLDPAMVRPGRIDVRVHMDRIGTDHIDDFLQTLGIEASDEIKESIGKLVDAEGKLLPAALQDTVYQHASKGS